mmetsp:Transcript_8877/g.16484  ORF Transcript_8877/g.16484 Transcript_8877/m.16484 type:complete len:238 (+) Transcript_8877:203-916(+)
MVPNSNGSAVVFLGKRHLQFPFQSLDWLRVLVLQPKQGQLQRLFVLRIDFCIHAFGEVLTFLLFGHNDELGERHRCYVPNALAHVDWALRLQSQPNAIARPAVTVPVDLSRVPVTEEQPANEGSAPQVDDRNPYKCPVTLADLLSSLKHLPKQVEGERPAELGGLQSRGDVANGVASDLNHEALLVLYLRQQRLVLLLLHQLQEVPVPRVQDERRLLQLVSHAVRMKQLHSNFEVVA